MSTSHRGNPAIVLSLWLALQLLTLLLAALKTPYSIHFVQPAERAALPEMLIVQITMAALAFPWLMRDAATGIAVVIVSWPITALAAFLSVQIDPWKIGCPTALVSGWLGGLGVWLYILRSQKTRLYGVAAATTLTLGGPLLWYLRADFGTGPAEIVWPNDGRWGPVMAALGLCNGSPANAASWQFLAGFLGLTALFATLTWLHRCDQGVKPGKNSSDF
jgi:hypothetical protein